MRLIDADKLYPDCMTKNGTLAISQSQIANAPTIEPEKIIVSEIGKAYTRGFDTGIETVRSEGEWVAITSCLDNDIHIICSHCKEEFIGKSTLEEWKKEYLFCHRCGAKMGGGVE